MQKLPEQVKQYGVTDVSGELVVQSLFINGCVIAFDVGAEHENLVMLAEVVMYLQSALPATVVALNVCTERMDRQGGCEDTGQHF